jgi:hypothetical protein
MATSFVHHKVNDYSTWRKVYDSVAEIQKAGGVTDEAVSRSVDDSNEVLVMHRFATMDQARSFLEGAELRDAMGQAGVDVSTLRVEFYEEA